ncbi:hypothetical protein ACHAWF_017971 [Thalassiosira exigua]
MPGADDAAALPRIPKKKRFAAAEDAAAAPGAPSADVPAGTDSEAPVGGKDTGEGAPPEPRGGEGAPADEEDAKDEGEGEDEDDARPADESAPDAEEGEDPPEDLEGLDPPILRKGDLVRLSHEAAHMSFRSACRRSSHFERLSRNPSPSRQKSGRIQGGLARVTRANFGGRRHPATGELIPRSYDIDYVLGGKVSNLRRRDLTYTTATAEGLVDDADGAGGGRGHLLRRRRRGAEKAEEEAAAKQEESKKKEAAKKEAAKKKEEKGRSKSDGGKRKSKPDREPPRRTASASSETSARKAKRPRREAVVAEEDGEEEEEEEEDEDDTATSKKRGAAKKQGAAKKRRGSKDAEEDEEAVIFEARSAASKAGWETRRAEAAAATKSDSKSSASRSSKRGSKRNSASEADSDAASASAAEVGDGSSAGQPARPRQDLYLRQRRELEKNLGRLEKVDRFAFFLDAVPPEFDEDYGDVIGGDGGEEASEGGDDDGETQVSASVDGLELSRRRRRAVQFPDHPPFNFLVIRKRLATGRYVSDMVDLELRRRHQVRAILGLAGPKKGDGGDNEVNERVKAGKEGKVKIAHAEDDKEKGGEKHEDKERGKCGVTEDDKQDYDNDIDAEYDQLGATMLHPLAVDWETFHSDVTAMCDAATSRDPGGAAAGAGHLGWAAAKIRKLAEEIHAIYGTKRRSEVEESESQHRYEGILDNCGNSEAAMQGKWRREAFPERRYERLVSSSVICDGLSPKDRSYAMYELETKLPDSFVGLAYTYDDSGQHSETWMKTVAGETAGKQQQPAAVKSKSRKRKKDSSSTSAGETNSDTGKNAESDSNARRAAMALASDDGVVRAQVQTTMTTLLIQVQDKVMTDMGVMNAPEARSANWDDGDRRRDYRGCDSDGSVSEVVGCKGDGAEAGPFEVVQGTMIHSPSSSPPEVAEQEVWGIDCYTRRNVTALIEEEFNPEIAVEFVERWLLPAINACPVDLAHKMSTAARLLEGLKIPDCSLNGDSGGRRRRSSQDDSAIPSGDDKATTRAYESSVFLRDAIESKIRVRAPPWLKYAARLVRLATDSLPDDYFRIHPKGHGSVVIGDDGLRANSLVTYYRGEVYPAWRWCEKLDAIERVQKKLDLRPNLPDFYNMAMERPKKDPRGYCLLFVDASRKSGLGSSFSHSCKPTCEVRVVSLHGRLSLSMTTLRDLEQGEELTFDYNAVTESLNEYQFAICLCGQRNCRGSFLHFATADCYQQVLSRNSPIAARFANLVRGSMKRVMSREDSDLLTKHGFDTAAFGAVSFNHHVHNIPASSGSKAGPGGSEEGSKGMAAATPDSIENVPVWLRTFVADCLRYIEYERRALPVALLCNQMERLEREQKSLRGKKSKGVPVTKKRRKAGEGDDGTGSSNGDSSKTGSVSRPKTSYFFFLQSQRERWEKVVQKEHGEQPKGLELSQALNKVASREWSSLGDEEKQGWKKKAIADWKRNKGKASVVKNREEEQQHSSKKGNKNPAPTKDVQSAKGVESEGTASGKSCVETKTISFADADAEGFSAMEQRIQQLAQSLSRVGRVLDRHRESVYAETRGQHGPSASYPAPTVDSDLLRELVPTPLKIMSDEEVVNFCWSNQKGIVLGLFAMVEQHFPERSLLRELLSSTLRGYAVLTAFSRYHPNKAPCFEKRFKHTCTAADARRLLREALLRLRTNIVDFLLFAERSHAEERNERRREKAREREERKRQEGSVASSGNDTPGCVDAVVPSKGTDAIVNGTRSGADNDTIPGGQGPSSLMLGRVKESLGGARSDMGTDTAMPMPIRGGGGECASTGPRNSLMGQRTLPVEVESGVILPAPMASPAVTGRNAPGPSIPSAQANNCHGLKMDSTKQPPQKVQSDICEDAASLLQLSQAAQSFGTVVPEVSASDQGVRPSSCPSVPMTGADRSPSKLQDLIDAASSEVGGDQKVGAVDPSSFSLASPPPTPSAGSPEKSGVDGEVKKVKKKVTPLSEKQVKYLKKWLFDPAHILNPYPTDEEKSKMTKDTGIERKRIDGWFMKNRQRVLNPEVRAVPMKWRGLDEDHWSDFRKNRYMLEATADMLLMHASTNTFFLLEPFRQFDSTPIEVYARELGNQVPSHFALSQGSAGPSPDAVDSDNDVQMDKSDQNESMGRSRRATKKTEAPKEPTAQLCSPEDVIDKVTVEYSGEYVLSQLLQWVNGGIGQKKGLPGFYGCVMLPPIAGCWEEIKCNEVKLPEYTKWNRKTATEYDAKIRPRLAKWMGDRYQRGSPWDKDVAKYFCPQGTSAPDPTLPMGSPVIDYLVTGIDDNMRHCQLTLSGCADTIERQRSALSASDRLQSTVDEGMPAQAVANWVQCENPECLKWRKLPWHVDVDLLPESFFCKDNIWNPKRKTCDAPEDEWDMEDAPIKFTNEGNFEVGVWFDVQREGKVGYHEAQVVEIDFESNVKRVKFHFYKLSNDRDEWVEIGSPRIAPHHSYTPRPLDGYGNKKNSDKNKGHQAFPSSAAPDTDKCVGNSPDTPPQKGKSDNSKPAGQNTNEDSKEQKNHPKAFAQETIDYLSKWISDNETNPFPTTEDKSRIMADTGLSKRQVSDWLARARKKLRKKSSEPETKRSPEKPKPELPKSDVATVKSVPSSPTKVENLLMALRNGNVPLTPSKEMNPTCKADQQAVKASPHQSVLHGDVVTSALSTGSGAENHKTTTKELDTYMKAWVSRPENQCDLMPTLAQKEKIIQETGIEKKRLEGWFFRARKRMKKEQESAKSSHRADQHATKATTETAKNALSSNDFGRVSAANSSGASQHLGMQLDMKAPTVTAIDALCSMSSVVPSITSSQQTSAPSARFGAAPLQISAKAPTKTAKNASSSSSGAALATMHKEALPKPTGRIAQPTGFSISPMKPINGPLSKHSGSKLVTSSMKAGGVNNKPLLVPKAGRQIAPASEAASLDLPINKQGLSEKAKSYLTGWLSEHSSNPYPTREEKNSMMFMFGIQDERKLEGWFCRARKKQRKQKENQRQNVLDSTSANGSNNGSISHDEFVLHANPIGGNRPEQSSGFASLLNAAKSELADRSPPSSVSGHKIAHAGRSAYQMTETSRNHGSRSSQMPPPSGAEQCSNPSNDDIDRKNRILGAREQAILSSFQSLGGVDIQNRGATHECASQSHQQASQAEYSSHQQLQGQAPLGTYSSYGQSQRSWPSPSTKVSSYPQMQNQHPSSSCQQSQGQKRNNSSEYQFSQNQHGGLPADYFSQQHSQGQGAHSAEYYQQSQRHHQASHQEYPAYHRAQTQQGGPHAKYVTNNHLHSYQHSEGQQQGQRDNYLHRNETSQSHKMHGNGPHNTSASYQH